MTKTKEDDLKSGSVVRCLLYDARVRTTHDKNAEVPNMGLSHMACAQTGSADIRDTKFGPCQFHATVGPSLVPRPSLRETTSGLPI